MSEQSEGFKLKEKPFTADFWVILVLNLIPIVGVIYFHWEPMAIITMYWLESLIIGFFHVIKILLSKGEIGSLEINGGKPQSQSYAKSFIAVFFPIHYGIFIGVQGVFMGVYTVLGDWMQDFPITYLWGIGAIFISQSFGLFYSYLYKGVYKKLDLGALMFLPYPRVIVQQFVAIIGSFFTVFLSANMGALIVFIVIKIIVDAGVVYINSENKL
jgi:hypothetical protein